MSTGVENTPNLEQLMQLGIQTARQGNKENARMIFQRILDADKQNERAWLWMAAVAETPMDRIRYLNTVLQINPNNATAQRELNQMKKKKETSNTQVLRYGALGLVVVFGLLAIAIILVTIL
jgi:thioredoxin-like negative regulator of GroEL